MILKSCVVLGCLLVAVVADEKYTSKYDNINVKEILDSKRLLHSYSNCMLEKGKCSPEGKLIRENISDALSNGCAKCTAIQRNRVREVIGHFIKHERGIWNELTAKYDPEGIWRKKYEEDARKDGIIIPKD